MAIAQTSVFEYMTAGIRIDAVAIIQSTCSASQKNGAKGTLRMKAVGG
jgi:hypothetical protein